MPAFPFDTATSILNVARSRINDLIVTPPNSPSQTPDYDLQYTQVGGSNLLREVQDDGVTPVARTQIIFNSANRRFQRFLGNLGYRQLIGDNLIITGLQPNTNPDPAVQSYLTWGGFFDGTTMNLNPQLPGYFMAPLKVSERLTGTNSVFIPMATAPDGLYGGNIRGQFDRQWEWRDQHQLFLPGATQTTDKQFRFIKYLGDITATVAIDGTVTPWYYQPVPIVNCQSSLAWFVAFEVAMARGDAEAPALEERGKAEAEEIFNDQARADQRGNLRRRPRGRGRRFGFSGGPWSL